MNSPPSTDPHDEGKGPDVPNPQRVRLRRTMLLRPKT
jgi:hypothetical protein